MQQTTPAGRDYTLSRIAVLDDYQGYSMELADWSAVKARAEVVVFVLDCHRHPRRILMNLPELLCPLALGLAAARPDLLPVARY